MFCVTQTALRNSNLQKRKIENKIENKMKEIDLDLELTICFILIKALIYINNSTKNNINYISLDFKLKTSL